VTPLPTTVVPAFMAKPPSIAPVRAFEPVRPTVFTLENGLRVVLIPKPGAALVDLLLVLPVGSNADPHDKAGLMTVTTDLLDESAGGKDSVELATELERLGARLTASAGNESTDIELVVLKSRLDAAASVLCDVVLHPALDDEDFDRVREQLVGELEDRRAEARTVAHDALANALYGDAPGGLPPLGYAETVGHLTAADARAQYERAFRPEGATLIVAGDLSAPDVRTRATRWFGAWPRGRAQPPPTARPLPHPPRLVLVNKPDAAQTVVRIGLATLPRAGRDFVALDAATTILGGSITSRLGRNLRERNNYVYDASAGLESSQGPGMLILSGDVVGPATAPAIAEFLKELEGLKRGIESDELVKAKALMRQLQVSGMETTQSFAHMVADLVSAGLSADAYRALPAELGRLRASDVTRVARSVLDLGRATIVIVGDSAQVQPTLQPLKLGLPELRDGDGRRRP
jgi:predicted Zn-dependent peptidase